MKEFFKKKWVKRSLVLIIIVIICFLMFGNKQNTIEMKTSNVLRGDLEVTISGNGTITASESQTQISKVSTKVEKVNYFEGDVVRKGDVIATLDDGDYEVNVEAQRNSVRQAGLNKANLDRQINALNIKAPISGYVSNLTMSEGSFVSSNMKFCDIISSNKYEITLQFVANDANKIMLGGTANIMLVNTMNYISGKITFVGERKFIVDGGVQVIEAKIEVEHQTYSLDGTYAKAEAQTMNGTMIESVNQAAFSSVNGANVLTEVTGTIKAINVKDGQYVNAGDTLAILENKDLVLSLNTTVLSLQSLNTQLKYMEDKLNDYKIIAPIDGKITKFDLKVGDQVTIGNILAVVSNENMLEFKIPVDELDISKINYESNVQVTVDAIPETETNPIVGKISKLPLQGETAGGVTDYYVTTEFEGREDIRISMNANAKIILSKAENIIYIPIEAIQKEDDKTFVEVKNADGTTESRNVVTGISNVSYIEIKEGLTENEEVVVPDIGSGISIF